jgi:hypothetical protein
MNAKMEYEVICQFLLMMIAITFRQHTRSIHEVLFFLAENSRRVLLEFSVLLGSIYLRFESLILALYNNEIF